MHRGDVQMVLWGSCPVQGWISLCLLCSLQNFYLAQFHSISHYRMHSASFEG